MSDDTVFMVCAASAIGPRPRRAVGLHASAPEPRADGAIARDITPRKKCRSILTPPTCGEEHRHAQPDSLPGVRVHPKRQKSRERDEDERKDDRSGVRQRFTLQVQVDPKLDAYPRRARMQT